METEAWRSHINYSRSVNVKQQGQGLYHGCLILFLYSQPGGGKRVNLIIRDVVPLAQELGLIRSLSQDEKCTVESMAD